MIKVLFFARLREQLGTEAIDIPWQPESTVGTLLQQILADHPAWSEFLSKPLMKAVNQEMSQDEQALSDGDEVAFFPPVTGG